MLLSKCWVLLRYCSYISDKRLVLHNCNFVLPVRIRIKKGCVLELKDGYFSKCVFSLKGVNNNAECQGAISSTTMVLDGYHNTVVLGQDVEVNQSRLIVRGKEGRCIIGDRTHIGGVYAVCMGEDNSLEIGQDCMLADNIDIWNSDTHAIWDKESSTVLNPSLPVRIGNHVWIGKNSVVLKGVSIGDGAIVGMNSIITKNVEPFSVVAGQNRILHTNVNWSNHYISE